MGIFLICMLVGFIVGYLWGREDGRLGEFGRQLDNHEATERRFMDMDRLYFQKEKKLKAELDYYERIVKESAK